MPWFDSETNLTSFFRLLAPVPGERILDVGAGRGVLAEKVRTKGNCEVWAVDRDKKRVATMQRNYPLLRSCEADSESLPYTDSYFDKVYTTLALHHFPDQRRSIQEFSRVLKPAGSLLIAEVLPRSAQGLFMRMLENGIMRSHLRFLEIDQLAGILREQGRFQTRTTTVISSIYLVGSTKVG
jgi:ubiquinone/menaquinone biosynthesis C-methylase UbiE